MDRPVLAPASHPDFQGKFGLDAYFARALVGPELGDFETRGVSDPHDPGELGQLIFPVCLEPFKRPVGRRDPAGRAQ